MVYLNHRNPDEIPEIPESVAICPICGSQLFISDIDEWEYRVGRVTWMGLHINCTTVPDIDDQDFLPWHNWHWAMPYVDWLPVKATVYCWFDQRYRIKTGKD